jgi:class 3 adenylate cyclase
MGDPQEPQDAPLDSRVDPAERTYFIERTGVIIRWMLIAAGTVIQVWEPVIPSKCFTVALPLAVLYNLLVRILLEKKREKLRVISLFTAAMDNVVSLVLIYLATDTDIYLWYFVLLVSHAARFGFVGALVSPVLFSLFYVGSLSLRGIDVPVGSLVTRATFFIITGIVSGYLAREEHRRFDRILKQQLDVLAARQKRKEMRDMLQRYLSYNLVDELLADPSKIRLGGVKRKVSVLFSDISGFTRLLSVTEPEKVVRVLNEYLTEMTGIIFRHDGMVDKFVGDAVIGIFGALKTSPGDTRRAVKTALAMQDRLRELQSAWKESMGEVIEARIAVNTGEVILGNIGSPMRMDYTAIGDAVNTACRLQAIAETGKVVVSRTTLKELGEGVVVKELGKVALKGKPEPIEAFEVVSLEEREERG